MEADLETVYDITEEKELTSEENVYLVPEGLFDPIKIYLTWKSDEELEDYPSFYVRISPNTWNQKTNTICSWLVKAKDDEDDREETIQILKQGELVDYIYYLFQNLYHDVNPSNCNEINLPNMPIIQLHAKKLNNREYMEEMAAYITDYIVFLTNHWPVRKSRLASESSSM